MTKKQLWKIYNESPTPSYYYEHYDNTKEFCKGYGLLLCICPKCGEKQTRENYYSGTPKSFWVQWITLIQDYEITGVAQHRCGQWCQVYG